ncbi:DUF1059 domain-containing protein [Halosimplex salinum]|uniref:DUF1059 domain-containing protein n=1 Tax=Halosimplex salinum TaxID=1710538 RepID=UPI000F4999C8|nr:DUF1059 domain-containing protein [Halosimplex salinum]
MTDDQQHAHRLDCEAAAADCRFIIQSETEEEAIELAKTHMRDVHGRDYTDEELRSEHLKVV